MKIIIDLNRIHNEDTVSFHIPEHLRKLENINVKIETLETDLDVDIIDFSNIHISFVPELIEYINNMSSNDIKLLNMCIKAIVDKNMETLDAEYKADIISEKIRVQIFELFK